MQKDARYCAECFHAKVTYGEKVYCNRGLWDGEYRELKNIGHAIRKCAEWESAAE